MRGRYGPRFPSADPYAQAQQGGVTGARLSEATARYDHGMLGNPVEWGALDLTLRDCGEGAEAVLAAAVSSPFA